MGNLVIHNCIYLYERMVCNLFIIVVSKLIPQRAPEHRHFDVRRIHFIRALAKLKFDLFLLHFTVYEIFRFFKKEEDNIFLPAHHISIHILFLPYLPVSIFESCRFFSIDL